MKRLLPATVASFLVASFVALMHLVAVAFAESQEKREVFQYLSDALTSLSPPQETVSWDSPLYSLVRPFTEFDERLVGLALSQAWRAHAASMDGGDPAALEDYFSGVALGRARVSALAAREEDAHMAVLAMRARPTMFHLDGSVLALNAETLTARFATTEDGLAHYTLTRDGVVSVLMNETTGWRVFAHELRSSEPLQTATDVPLSDLPLSGLNYYPASTPWRKFWPGFDEATVSSDLDRIAGLGANAVRIFLPYADFADPEAAALNIPRLERFLFLAEARGLTVMPTLFDMMPGFSTAEWPDHYLYLKRVLPVLAASPAVGIVDLKNEPDLDDTAHGTGLIRAWLRTMVALVRHEAPALALTIGWSDAAHAPDLADHLDAVSYHDYAPLEGSAARLAQVRAEAGGKPVYVTEIGQSSWELALGYPGSPEKQAQGLAARLEALSGADGLFVWSLHDFEQVDVEAVGVSPWVRRLQSSFGLFALDGTPKPAADAVRNAFGRFLGPRGS